MSNIYQRLAKHQSFRTKSHKIKTHLNSLCCGALTLAISACSTPEVEPLFSNTQWVSPNAPVSFQYQVNDKQRTKRVTIDLFNPSAYASISLYADDQLLIDNLNVPTKGHHSLSALVQLPDAHSTQLTLKSNNASLEVTQVSLVSAEQITFPEYQDISVKAGLDKASSIKYGGPTVADLDNDGDYDFIVNNHNEESSKLYWNNGDGTVSKHDKNLARWFMHDLHGTAAGDFDNDGDLDMVVTQGGGNGKNPSKANFYTNNKGKLVLTTGDVDIKRGGRGRGARWTDADSDGDLDLMLVNEASLTKQKPQHFFYENKGNGTFNYRPVEQLQDMEASRVLITDINNDHVDDIIIYSPLSIWQGNGDFTYTNITEQLPKSVQNLRDIMALTHIDIDNDGDLDLYLARGKVFEHGKGEAPSLDHIFETKELSIKTRGYKGTDSFSFTADGDVTLTKYNYLMQGIFRGKKYPIFLGQDKQEVNVSKGEELTVSQQAAMGWPQDISENGVYIGYEGHVNGEHQWRAALVRSGAMFWTFRFSLLGVNSVTPDFEPENRNIADILLRNDNNQFVDVSTQWQLPTGGNALGVTTGDFNNDSHQDLLVYRWGYISQRISDFMLINTGNGQFETVTMHGANDVGGPGNGDMGQAFDFDLDGKLDILSGSEDGEWYLYQNTLTPDAANNFALVRVGYSPKENVDPISAKVTITTKHSTYQANVGSAGAVFSQSLLNTVHFGLGKEDHIERIDVKWRNGETVTFGDKSANQIFDTNQLDPAKIYFAQTSTQLRVGTSKQLQATIFPTKANQALNWTSSHPDVIQVDKNGKITALQINKDSPANQATVTITATSAANGISASTNVTLVDWFENPLKQIKLTTNGSSPLEQVAVADMEKVVEIVEGETITLNANLTPNDADNAELKWQVNNSHVVVESVSPQSTSQSITAVSAGTSKLLVTSVSNPEVSAELTVNVSPNIQPFVTITNADEIRQNPLKVGDKVTVKVDYHAGTGNHVINADEGGIRFWLRHFKSKWIPAKDMVKVDANVLKTTSGQSEMTFKLDGLTPTNALPEGHFYQLRVTFTSSNGEMIDDNIYPLNIYSPNTLSQ